MSDGYDGDGYNGIKVGDTVRRVKDYWNGHDVGWEGVVTRLHNGHLSFEDSHDIGHSPMAHVVIKRGRPVEELFEHGTVETLRWEGR